MVAIGYSKNIEMQEFRSKEWLFYVGGGLFFVFNIMIQALKKIVSNLPASVLPAANKPYWNQEIEHKEALHEIYETWLNSFNLIFNLLLIFIFLALFLVNVIGFNSFNFYQPIIIGLVVLLAIWWVVLPIRLSIKNIVE